MDQQPADLARAVFIEGMGAASATSGVLSQLQGRIFAALLLKDHPLSLDEIAVPNSRKDHYEAASDFWRVMQEIMERRFRWNIRQVIAACDETSRTAGEGRAGSRAAERDRQFIEGRLKSLRSFAAAVDAGIGAFARGEPITPQAMQVIHINQGKKR
jgi:DNA-binding transcriptional regulator GbsR (MarR family)